MKKTRSLHVSYRKPLGVNYPKNINSIQRSQEVSINDSLSYSFQKSSSSFLSLENIIFNLTNDNIEQSSELTMKFYDVNYPYSFNLCICRLVYRAFISQRNEETIYFDFLKSLQIKEKANKNHTVFNVFNEYLIKLNSHESFYLIEKMIEQKLIDPAFTIKHHYKDQFYRRFISNNKEISKDDWKLHKELVKEGVNPLKIVNVIRDDDLEKLQEISTQNDFDFNQLIKSSPYERYSFISNKYQNISIIDYCAFFRSVKCFKFLLINGATIRYTLKYAIAGGNLEIIHLCEQNHSKIDNVYEIAIEFHRNDIFHYFYNKKVIEINNLTQLGIKCIEYDNYEILFFLEQEGMEINNKIIQKLGWTGNVFIIRSFQNTKLLNAILPEASYSNNYEIVSFLLEQKGIKVNEKDEYGYTALMFACQNGHIEIVKLLLEQKRIHVNEKNIANNKTALMYASENGHIEIVNLLLKRKLIDINAKDNCNWTALMFASQKGHIKIVELLLKQNNIDINVKNNWRCSALVLASRNGNIEIVELLLKQKDIDINTKDISGFSSLMYASYFGYINIVKLLLEQNDIDVNSKDIVGYSALRYAFEHNHNEIVKLLLKHPKVDITEKEIYSQKI